MHLDHLVPVIAHLAGTAVGTFVLAVLIDNVLGVALAVKMKSFDSSHIASFVESQFGTRKALALLGLVAAAAVAPSAGADIKSAVLVALTTGAAALSVSVIGDCKDKLLHLVGI